MDFCTLGTPEYVLISKFPLSIGDFFMDNIAGHEAATVADNPNFKIYFNGESRFYIDGSTNRSKRLLCNDYDEI